MRQRSSQRRVQREATSASPEAWPDTDELVIRAQRLRQLSEAVETLDEPLRATVLLHYFEGLSLAEIARREGCPSPTVRGRLRTALARLRDDLDARYEGCRADWLAAFAPLAVDGGIAANGAAGASTPTLSLGALALIAVGVGVALRSPEPGEPPRSHRPDEALAIVSSPPSGTEPAMTPTTPFEPAAAMRFENEDEREARRAAVLAARVARLTNEGLDVEIVEDAADDATLLGDIESMMMMEDAARFAIACVEETPPKTPGKLYASVEFIGEPDVGTVIEDVVVDEERSTHGTGEFATCIEESLFMLSVAPPEAGGTQTKVLFFDTTQTPVLTGSEAPAP